MLAAFEAEALPHLDRLFRIAMWLVRDRVKAEKLVRETLTQACVSFRQCERDVNYCAWLVQTMYQVKNKRQRLWGGQANLQSIGNEDEPAATTIQLELATPEGATAQDILHALGSLSREEQEVIVLSDIEELTYREVADVLSISVSSLMARLSSARKRLRTQLARDANRRDQAGKRNLLEFAGGGRR